MKKVVEDLAVKNNLETAYSGANRILYIKGKLNKEFIAYIHEKYPSLAFELKAVDTFSVSIGEFDNPKHEEVKVVKGSAKLPIEGKIFTGNGADKELAHKIVEQSMESVFGPLESLPLSEEDKEVENKIIAEESEEERKLRIRTELDIYLTENSIDKSKKGFFVPIAEKFGVTSDYVRKRYNSLKKKD